MRKYEEAHPLAEIQCIRKVTWHIRTTSRLCSCPFRSAVPCKLAKLGMRTSLQISLIYSTMMWLSDRRRRWAGRQTRNDSCSHSGKIATAGEGNPAHWESFWSAGPATYFHFVQDDAQ